MALAGKLKAMALKEKLSSEEKELTVIWLLRAKRMYDIYCRDRDGDCLSFPEYASCFHGLSEELAQEWASTGDIAI